MIEICLDNTRFNYFDFDIDWLQFVVKTFTKPLNSPFGGMIYGLKRRLRVIVRLRSLIKHAMIVFLNCNIYSILQNNFKQKYCNSKFMFIFAAKSNMRVVSHKKLKAFFETKGREDSRVALERWYDIVEKAEWKNLSDIKADFPSVDYVGNQHYVFNIKRNQYRLVVVIKFTIGYIFIRFVGTHKEYDIIDSTTI